MKRDVEEEVPDRSEAATGSGPRISEEQYRLLVDSVRDYAIFMLDPSGHVVTWNAGARAIKGYAPEEILGQHLSIFYTPEDRARQRPQRLLEAALGQGRVEDEGWRVRKDGSRFWADVVITALRDPQGRFVGYAKVTRDLTSRRAAEDTLRRTEERLFATLSSIGDGVLATDEAGRLTIINRVAQRLTGWSEGEALGRPIEEVFRIVNEHTRATAANPVPRVLREGIVIGLANHTALIARDGSECPIADSGAPIRDVDGVTRGAVLVFRDVREERRAEEALRQSEERLRLMISSVHDYAIYMLDAKGDVVTWNTGAAKIKGYREEEILGANYARFFTPEDVAAGKPQQELDQAAREGRFEDETWRVRRDGSRFWASVVLSAIRDANGRLVGFAKVTRDLTDSRKLEEERVRLAQAQEAVRLRDEFLSIASHELKTPLTAMQLQLLGVRDRVRTTDEKLGTRLDKAIRAGDRLTTLIEALLDVSRIATGKLVLNLDPFDLADLAREVVDAVRAAAANAHCELSLSADQPVPGTWDRLRVGQILMNLLSNAFRYAPGAPVEVTVAKEGKEAVVTVRDHGAGLREKDFERIFGRFERASSANYGGMGLGLYIARQVAEAHRGSVTATNLDEGGACFAVRLPLAPGSTTAAVGTAAPAGRGADS